VKISIIKTNMKIHTWNNVLKRLGRNFLTLGIPMASGTASKCLMTPSNFRKTCFEQLKVGIV
jgi:hypothetical protein